MVECGFIPAGAEGVTYGTLSHSKTVPLETVATTDESGATHAVSPAAVAMTRGDGTLGPPSANATLPLFTVAIDWLVAGCRKVTTVSSDAAHKQGRDRQEGEGQQLSPLHQRMLLLEMGGRLLFTLKVNHFQFSLALRGRALEPPHARGLSYGGDSKAQCWSEPQRRSGQRIHGTFAPSQYDPAYLTRSILRTWANGPACNRYRYTPLATPWPRWSRPSHRMAPLVKY